MALTILVVAAIVLLNLLRLKTQLMETVNERSQRQSRISGTGSGYTSLINNIRYRAGKKLHRTFKQQ